jgi:hypothetical protein
MFVTGLAAVFSLVLPGRLSQKDNVRPTFRADLKTNRAGWVTGST